MLTSKHNSERKAHESLRTSTNKILNIQDSDGMDTGRYTSDKSGRVAVLHSRKSAGQQRTAEAMSEYGKLDKRKSEGTGSLSHRSLKHSAMLGVPKLVIKPFHLNNDLYTPKANTGRKRSKSLLALENISERPRSAQSR